MKSRQYRLSLTAVWIALVLTLSVLQLEGGIVTQFSKYLRSVQNPNGISLNVYQNSSAITPNEQILITVMAQTTLGQTINVPNPAQAHWTIGDLSSGPCGYMYPIGIVVRDASGLFVAVFNIYGIFSCPAFIITSFQFGPHANIEKSVSMNGYWTPGMTPEQGGFSYGVHHPFLPGTYRVVVGDIWGDSAATSFTVVSL